MMDGHHLIVDGYECDPGRLTDLECIYDFLDRAPEVIGMTKMMPPFVCKFHPIPPRPPEDAGLSGFVIIAESHISIHTYPEKAFLSADFYSCKVFPIDLAIDLLVEQFKIGRWVHRVCCRGVDYPQEIYKIQAVSII
jgi:S-adenosylmethionine decarboxylase